MTTIYVKGFEEQEMPDRNYYVEIVTKDHPLATPVEVDETDAKQFKKFDGILYMYLYNKDRHFRR